jgi:DNA invertase Pin-like site-specific DNA recombinase
MNAPSKIEPRHLRLQALVYIRQSTPQQVVNNQESTRRQYDLVDRARQMGWPETGIHVIDDDLGLSGASSQQRGGFQRLVAAIGLGEVGIVLVTEVSRLSRCNSDWHRVIELCAVFRTLIADEDGIYDPQNPNDQLLLGVKGTLFAAELHILQARMHGALLNKARRGDLKVTLPVGYRRRPDGIAIIDPDDAVRQAVSMVFERFAVLRNARAVQRHFLENGLLLPRLLQSGPDAGRIAWMRPSYQMIQKMLVNPAYAGTFVYGRVKREAAPGDPPSSVERRRPPEEWDIVVQDVYPAYLSFDAYLANRRQLRDNLSNFACKSRGAPREGAALLHGLVVCGRCGSRMAVSYGRGDQHRRYECRRAQANYAEPACQSFLAREVDRIAAEAFLDAVRPAGLETTIAALQGLAEERRSIDHQWCLRLERARYEARMAQRQYDAVDPDNRLVARELERRWEAALGAVDHLEQEYAHLQRTELSPLTEEETEEVRRLAADLPALWHAETTTAVDRKRLLRLAIVEVTIVADAVARTADVRLLWSGGAATRHSVRCPPPGWHLRTDPDVLAFIRDLAGQHPDHRIANRLNARGLRTQTGKPWTYDRVASMRRVHGIPTGCPVDTTNRQDRSDGFVPAAVAARCLGQSLAAIRVWAHDGALSTDQRRTASKIWVRLTPEDIARLDGTADVTGLPTLSEVTEQAGLTRAAVWQRVREGAFIAYRTSRGPAPSSQWEWRLRPIGASLSLNPDSARKEMEQHHEA